MAEMSFTFFDLLGTLGVALILLAYFLLQIEKLKSGDLIFSVINAAGSGLILVSLYFDFNFPSFLVEGFWLIISTIGIVKYFFNKRNGSNNG